MAKNGGYKGFLNTPALNVAPGRWGIKEAYAARKNETWPGVFDLEYVVVAGGAGGGYGRTFALTGGAGAGGYRSSVAGENSGGGASAENPISITLDASYSITVGAGGAGVTTDQNDDGDNGSDSTFANITSIGGGRGGNGNGATGKSGGSGGGAGGFPDGAGTILSGGSGTSGQGFSGGDAIGSDVDAGRAAGGGGGAGEPGYDGTPDLDGSSSIAGAGGDGVASSITGTSVTRAGGGGSANRADCSGTLAAAGGAGGGGNASFQSNASSGTANTGGGGGSVQGNNSVYSSGSGGSGIVILKYPKTLSIDAGPGLTYFTNVVGSNKVSQFVAGTDDISFTTTQLDKSIIYTDRSIATTVATVNTFSNLSFGTQENRNVVAVFIGGRLDAAINSVTIGGQPATLAYGHDSGGFSYIYYATGVSGTSGDVVVDFSNKPEVAGAAVYSLYNLDNVDPVDGGVANLDGASSLTVSGITGAAGGVGLAGTGVNDSNVGSQTFSATDNQSIVEIWDEITSSPNTWAGAALYNVTSDNFDVTVTYSEARNHPSMAVAVWK